MFDSVSVFELVLISELVLEIMLVILFDWLLVFSVSLMKLR